MGIGVAFNNCTGFGNDPIGIVYDGIRSITGMNQAQLGMASNVVNVVLLVFLFFAGRRYVSVGTFVYLIPYGFCVDLGTFLYHQLAFVCTFLCLGVAIYITVDIGVDPFTGLVLVLWGVIKKEYRYVKIGFDLAMVVLGTVLGGKLGVVTVVTALAVGPIIQIFMGVLKKFGSASGD